MFMNIFLLNKTCKYQLVFATEKKKIQFRNLIGFFCPGKQGDANLQVPLALLRLHIAMYHF